MSQFRQKKRLYLERGGRESSSCGVRYLKMESAPRGDGAYSLHFNYLFLLYILPTTASSGQRSPSVRATDVLLAPSDNECV